MSWRWLFFGFKGRINRAKYWLTMLAYMVAGIVLAGIGYAAGDTIVWQALRSIADLALAVSGLAVAVKRLHDRDKSAWWVLFFYLFPFALIFIAIAGAFAGINGLGELAVGWGFLVKLCIVAAIAIGVWFFAELACFRGTRGYNRYGADPIPARKPRQLALDRRR
jgi:uncharacterized membrane protein YhaH (DUF805 family)